ncbi:hypothetical protein [Salidesulfovibrio onnuriiensis]|uniref:hypothetical protein n=1 Tax=Salidesulfovibrio onnuriiensis TaxID=2583823 RepID=UPI0011CB8BBA|nr:hypothetical protein [Salidesulfovibrio onnuriiensis]
MKNAGASRSDSEPARLSDDVNVLESEIARFTLEREKALTRVKELMAAEDPKQGISHHEEIFRLQQDKLRFDVEIKFRQNKINRINLGMDENEAASGGPADGFLF